MEKLKYYLYNDHYESMKTKEWYLNSLLEL